MSGFLHPILRHMALLLALCFISAAWADPPGRVGRISYLSGAVSFSENGAADNWVPATLNYPLTAGHNLWTDSSARAELHIGASVLRMDQRTALVFSRLDDRDVDVHVSQGVVNVKLRGLLRGETFTVTTPSSVFHFNRNGHYRIDVAESGDASTLTVREGEADVRAGEAEFTAYSGQTANIAGSDRLTYAVDPAGREDEFDAWALDRDRVRANSVSARYVSPAMTGYQELDDNGSWRETPGYGAVWVPRAVSQDWAPYRYGHWAWVSPWGWTWIDDASWGFAPFHYGRWVHYDGLWGWAPGQIVARPYYAPALVVFLGAGGLSASAGLVGHSGWFPLAPQEVYVPSYPVSQTYIRNVNITNVNVQNINVTNQNISNVNYVNRTVAGAVTVVPDKVLAAGHPVAAALVPVAVAAAVAAKVSSAPMVRPVVAPVASAAANNAKPPAEVLQRHLAGPPANAAVPAIQGAKAVGSNSPATPAQAPGTPGAPAGVKPPAQAAGVAVPPSTKSPSRANGVTAQPNAVPNSPRDPPARANGAPVPPPGGRSPAQALTSPEAGVAVKRPPNAQGNRIPAPDREATGQKVQNPSASDRPGFKRTVPPTAQGTDRTATPQPGKPAAEAKPGVANPHPGSEARPAPQDKRAPAPPNKADERRDPHTQPNAPKPESSLDPRVRDAAAERSASRAAAPAPRAASATPSNRSTAAMAPAHPPAQSVPNRPAGAAQSSHEAASSRAPHPAAVPAPSHAATHNPSAPKATVPPPRVATQSPPARPGPPAARARPQEHKQAQENASAENAQRRASGEQQGQRADR